MDGVVLAPVHSDGDLDGGGSLEDAADCLVFRALRLAKKYRRGMDDFTKLIGQVAAVEIIASRLETRASLPDGSQSPGHFPDLLLGRPFNWSVLVCWREQVRVRVEDARVRLSVGFRHIEQGKLASEPALRQYQ